MGSRAKLRNQMSAIFRHGIRWGWIGPQENPIAMVRASGKRLTTPETLTAEEFPALFGKLPGRERAMGTTCATTGLRISETLGLKWEDIDFEKRQANVLRSVVDGAIGRCKSEISQQPVPLDELTLDELRSWRKLTMYASDADWAVASERVLGRWRSGRMLPCRRCCNLRPGGWDHQGDRLAHIPAYLQLDAV